MRLGVIAIEDIRELDDYATGVFYTYEFILMGMTIDDLIKLSNFEINSEGLTTVLSRGYVKMKGRIIKEYGKDKITEDNITKLITMFNEITENLYERM
ncbi:hypothetical protein [Acidianus manzaensis]|uniref:Uncharacterized protein n=1 Tax=Acidianus manzaensis TaxID=282676 RepID=A0A1W6K3E2_9CREN|nr:hypothetical protein [Acidianus manzaensis]ARM76952.1 hypothetical protein B6F84_13625 [Acidianus manzaensis]